ncbi:ABC transporter permease [Streptomyces sp. SID8352]|uniref:ABC transporter permease n=1 Tax=Streptomyces sp. SID8352 TaxID=2690338 RepID=UPI001371E80A|nr:ABC transporter permease [Streptomyces sp. SID8352]MYU25061.1 ABC transporter permease subunit [Streptomyces sp. SID8352]
MDAVTTAAGPSARPPAPAPAPTRTRRFGLGRGAPPLLAVPLLFLTGCLVVPLFFVLRTAFSDESDVTFLSTVQDPLFRAALLRTIVMAAVVTVICVVLGLVFALALSMTRGAVRAVLGAGLAATFVISLMVRTYGWIILMQPKGLLADLLNTLHVLDGPLDLLQTAPAMYLGMVHVMLPYSVLLTYSVIQGLDPNQLKAARGMGASGLLTFRRVVLPQIMSGVAAGAILVFMISLSFYVTPAFLGGPTQLTMGTLIGREMGEIFDFKSAAIMGTILLAVVGALYLLAERLFRISEMWENT